MSQRPLVCPRNDRLTNRRWRVTTQIWVVLLRDWSKILFNQWEELPRSGWWHVISMEFLQSFARHRLSLHQAVNFTLHLIKVGKLKQFKKVSSDLKTILKTDLANLRFLSFEKGEACQSILIMLRGKIGLSKLSVKLSFTWRIKNLLVLKYFLTYLGSSVKTTIISRGYQWCRREMSASFSKNKSKQKLND